MSPFPAQNFKKIPIYRQTPDQPPQRLFIILRAGDLSRHTQNLNALILTWRNLVRLILCNLAHPKGRARESSAVPRILHIICDQVPPNCLHDFDSGGPRAAPARAQGPAYADRCEGPLKGPIGPFRGGINRDLCSPIFDFDIFAQKLIL